VRGLVGENGTISTDTHDDPRAYHDGIERLRHVVRVQRPGQGSRSIVPLPAVPSKWERAGDWTLQRAEREVAPPQREAFDSVKSAAASTGAE